MKAASGILTISTAIGLSILIGFGTITSSRSASNDSGEERVSTLPVEELSDTVQSSAHSYPRTHHFSRGPALDCVWYMDSYYLLDEQ